MALKYETTHDYYMESMNVGYIEDMDTLFVQDTDENTISIHGVDADDMVRLARNMFCARDKVWNYVKEVQKEHVNDQLKEIHEAIGEYLIQEKLIEEIESLQEKALAEQGVK